MESVPVRDSPRLEEVRVRRIDTKPDDHLGEVVVAVIEGRVVVGHSMHRAVNAVGHERVEHALQRRERERPENVHSRDQVAADGGEDRLRLFRWPGTSPHDPAHGLGVQLSREGRPGGTLRKANQPPRVSGAARMKSRYQRITSSARSIGQSIGPAYTVRIGCSRNTNEVTTPKFPPPPRTAQNRSWFSSALAVTNRPSAKTMSTASRLSIVRPYPRERCPIPPPRVRPPTPVVETKPDGWPAEGVRGMVHVAPDTAAFDACSARRRVDP